MEEALGGRTRSRRPPSASALPASTGPTTRRSCAASCAGSATRARTLVVNDALVALTAGAADGPGIVVICGTGLDLLRADARGTRGAQRRLGLRPRRRGQRLLDWPARAGRRGARTPTGGARRRADAARAGALRRRRASTDLVQEVHVRDPRRHRVASLGEVVQAAVEDGDAVAREIVDAAARELVTRRRVGGRAARDARPRSSRSSSREACSASLPSLREQVLTAAGRGRAAQRAPCCSSVEPAIGAVRLALAEARGGARAAASTSDPCGSSIFPDECARRPRSRAHDRRPLPVRDEPDARAGAADGPHARCSCIASSRGSPLPAALDLRRATTFNLDEFLGAAATHPGSYRAVHGAAPVPPRGSPARADSLPRWRAPPMPTAECARYERAIAAAGGIDLQILGIGANGHIGFNEPAPGARRAHAPRRRCGRRRVESNAGLFGGDADQRAARSAVDGHGDDPPGAPHRARRDGTRQGGLRPSG